MFPPLFLPWRKNDPTVSDFSIERFTKRFVELFKNKVHGDQVRDATFASGHVMRMLASSSCHSFGLTRCLQGTLEFERNLFCSGCRSFMCLFVAVDVVFRRHFFGVVNIIALALVMIIDVAAVCVIEPIRVRYCFLSRALSKKSSCGCVTVISRLSDCLCTRCTEDLTGILSRTWAIVHLYGHSAVRSLRLWVARMKTTTSCPVEK